MSSLDAKVLYQSAILEHARSPRNRGPLEGATHEAAKVNALCGDRVSLRLRVDDATVRAAAFEARGCMIAVASSSLLTEAIAGVSVERALALARGIHALISGEASSAEAAETDAALLVLRGAREFPARRACVLLAWDALAAALDASRDS